MVILLKKKKSKSNNLNNYVEPIELKLYGLRPQ